MNKKRATPVNRRLVAMQERIEELEGAGILNRNALRLQKEKCDALQADNARLREALERIGKYPRVSGDELGYEGCRIVAREALAKVRKP